MRCFAIGMGGLPGHIFVAMIPPLQTYSLVPDILLGVGSFQGCFMDVGMSSGKRILRGCYDEQSI